MEDDKSEKTGKPEDTGKPESRGETVTLGLRGWKPRNFAWLGTILCALWLVAVPGVNLVQTAAGSRPADVAHADVAAAQTAPGAKPSRPAPGRTGPSAVPTTPPGSSTAQPASPQVPAPPAPPAHPAIHNPWVGDTPRAGDIRTCIATYYGGPEDRGLNNGTASGEWFDWHGITAAHRTLPFNSMVLVRNTDNGATVTVRINDSGPNVALTSRCIDLSKAAFMQIAATSRGKVPVEITVLSEGRNKAGVPNRYRAPPWSVRM